MKLSTDSKDIVFICTMRFIAFSVTAAVAYGSWRLSGWLIENGYLPGTTNPELFGYVISQAFGALMLMMLALVLMHLMILGLIEIPRRVQKAKFWNSREKKWPRS